MKLIHFLMIAWAFTSCSNALSDLHYYESHVKALSSTSFAGRSDYQGGNAKAADYLHQEIQQLGQTAVDLPFTYNKNTMHGAVAFEVDGKPYTYIKDFIVKEFSTGKTDSLAIYYLPEAYYTPEAFGPYLNSGAFAHSFVVLDYDLFRAKMDGPHPGIYAENTETYLENFGPLTNVGGVIFVYKEMPRPFVSKAHYTVPFPVIGVGPDFPKDAKQAYVQLETSFLTGHKATNIATLLPGTESGDSCLVLMAHYDHLGMIGQGTIFPGANDNASGVAMLLTLMRHYAQHPSKQTLLFLFLDGEEGNLLGAYDYVHHPWKPLEDIKCAINLDMIGDDSEYLIYEMGSHAEPYLSMFLKLNATQKGFTGLQPEPLSDNSDHFFFATHQVPVLYFTIEGSKYVYYHTPEDTFAHTSSVRFESLYNLLTGFIDQL